jgi:IclR family pca regulon transcriptional regulator
MYKVEALARGLNVLALFSRERPTMAFSDIVAASGLSKATVFRILSTLSSLGYLERNRENRRYRPSLKVLQLGFTTLSSLELRHLARPLIERLAQRVSQTVSMAVLDGMDVVYIDRVRHNAVLGVVLGMGSRIPAHAASLGKAILAFLPPEELLRCLDGAKLPACTPHTASDRSALCAELDQVRELGYSLNDEEWVLGLRSTAAPILNDHGEVVASINSAVPAALVSRAELERRISPQVHGTALEISRMLGYDGALGVKAEAA